ncbi:MAG: hypothetical protein M3Q29_21905 [Chloroflexota bacterium]|nr:hypothetical protein [Chloroflexota bacterium]
MIDLCIASIESEVVEKLSRVQRFFPILVPLLLALWLLPSTAQAAPPAQDPMPATSTAATGSSPEQTPGATDPTAQPPTDPRRATPVPTVLTGPTPNTAPSIWSIPTARPTPARTGETPVSEEPHQGETGTEHAEEHEAEAGGGRTGAIISGIAVLALTALVGLFLLRRT